MRVALAVLLLSLAVVSCGPGGGNHPGECTDTLLIPGDLVISEVFADSSAVDTGKEWFEIYNNADRPVDLEGMTITYSKTDGTGGKTHVMTSVTVQADSYLVLGNTLPDLVPTWVDYGYADSLGDLGNTDGMITLGCGDTQIDSATYDMVDTGKSRQFDGGGLPDYTANDDLANWCAATPEGADEFDPGNFGTPGSPNEDCAIIVAGQCNDGGTMRATVPPAPGDLVITEVMPNPSGDDNLQEWFEVLATADVDLNGVGLDRAGDTGMSPKVLDSEDCIHVTAGTYLVFAKSADATMNGMLPRVDGTFTFSMVSGSAASPGDVQLLLGTTTIDAFTWTHTSSNASLQVDPDFANATDNDLEANWCDGVTPYGAGTDLGTPGAVNEQCAVVIPPGMCLDEGTMTVRSVDKPTTGEIALTEWMPNPALASDTNGEWVEVHALADFDLNGLQLGSTTLSATPVITTSTCVPITTGGYALFARSTDPALNGMLPAVDGKFTFSLVNSAGTVQVGIDDAALDTKTWTTSASGVSIQIDTDGTQCNAPATTPSYNGGSDLGTPRAVHTAECP